MNHEKYSVAIIGGGVAGIVSSFLLSKKHDVTLFEKNDYLGGHTNTIPIKSGPDAGLAVDTGFIVLNDRTYPNFHSFLKAVNVKVRKSDMSFGYYCENTNLQYAGTTLNGLFAQRKNLYSPAFYSLLSEIFKFNQRSKKALANEELEGVSVEEYLRNGNYSSYFISHYLVPMGAAIWSSSQEGIQEFPAKTFLQFFLNHGLLSVPFTPQWQTVEGGSNSYVKAFKQIFNGKIVLNSGVTGISRTDSGVEVHRLGHVSERFDKVVIATHADQAFKLLHDATPIEKKLLSPWQYHKNKTVLHTDTRILPPTKRAWASWNYRRTQGESDKTSVYVSYHMNRLQGITSKDEYIVSLNARSPIDQNKVIYEVLYEHPAFTLESISTQPELSKLNGTNNTYFAGSYFGYGFHEDAVKSAVEVSKRFGIEL